MLNETIDKDKVLILPEGLRNIDDEAFMGISAEQINIPSGTTSIGSKSFSKCSQLKLVVMPDSVVTIADDAFDSSEPVFICQPGSSTELFAEKHSFSYYHY